MSPTTITTTMTTMATPTTLTGRTMTALKWLMLIQLSVPSTLPPTVVVRLYAPTLAVGTTKATAASSGSADSVRATATATTTTAKAMRAEMLLVSAPASAFLCAPREATTTPSTRMLVHADEDLVATTAASTSSASVSSTAPPATATATATMAATSVATAAATTITPTSAAPPAKGVAPPRVGESASLSTAASAAPTTPTTTSTVSTASTTSTTSTTSTSTTLSALPAPPQPQPHPQPLPLHKDVARCVQAQERAMHTIRRVLRELAEMAAWRVTYEDKELVAYDMSPATCATAGADIGSGACDTPARRRSGQAVHQALLAHRRSVGDALDSTNGPLGRAATALGATDPELVKWLLWLADRQGQLIGYVMKVTAWLQGVMEALATMTTVSYRVLPTEGTDATKAAKAPPASASVSASDSPYISVEHVFRRPCRRGHGYQEARARYLAAIADDSASREPAVRAICEQRAMIEIDRKVLAAATAGVRRFLAAGLVAWTTSKRGLAEDDNDDDDDERR